MCQCYTLPPPFACILIPFPSPSPFNPIIKIFSMPEEARPSPADLPIFVAKQLRDKELLKQQRGRKKISFIAGESRLALRSTEQCIAKTASEQLAPSSVGPRDRTTKTIVTVGPSCDPRTKPEVVEALLEAGADMFRINLAFGDGKECAAIVAGLRDIRCGVCVRCVRCVQQQLRDGCVWQQFGEGTGVAGSAAGSVAGSSTPREGEGVQGTTKGGARKQEKCREVGCGESCDVVCCGQRGSQALSLHNVGLLPLARVVSSRKQIDVPPASTSITRPNTHLSLYSCHFVGFAALSLDHPNTLRTPLSLQRSPHTLTLPSSPHHSL